MKKTAIIGGTGLTNLHDLVISHEENTENEFGKPSAALTHGRLSGKDLIFLPRHGNPHVIPPHLINYRANIKALKDAGVNSIIAVNAVGAISADARPGKIVIPSQIIDYTYGRKHTFFEKNIEQVTHIDFTCPYSETLRQTLVQSAQLAGIEPCINGTYGVTQGPRLETAAEITRMERDGCTLVGMTGMPEAALARELELDYASVCIVANRAAGKSSEVITMEIIEHNLGQGIRDACQLLETLFASLD